MPCATGAGTDDTAAGAARPGVRLRPPPAALAGRSQEPRRLQRAARLLITRDLTCATSPSRPLRRRASSRQWRDDDAVVRHAELAPDTSRATQPPASWQGGRPGQRVDVAAGDSVRRSSSRVGVGRGLIDPREARPPRCPAGACSDFSRPASPSSTAPASSRPSTSSGVSVGTWTAAGRRPRTGRAAVRNRPRPGRHQQRRLRQPSQPRQTITNGSKSSATTSTTIVSGRSVATRAAKSDGRRCRRRHTCWTLRATVRYRQ